MANIFKESKKYSLSSVTIIEKLNVIKTSKDINEIDKCRNDVVMANICLIGKVMKPYLKFKSLSQDDMLNEGVLGIYTAIEKFDLDKNVQFSTYAFFWIKQKIQRFIENNCMNKIDQSSTSIDTSVGGSDDEDDRTLGDIIPTKTSNNLIENEDISNSIAKSFTVLSDKEKFVIKARFGLI